MSIKLRKIYIQSHNILLLNDGFPDITFRKEDPDITFQLLSTF